MLCYSRCTKGVDVKSMTNKVRFTYRTTETLFEKIAEEASKKGISINSEITNVLWKYYFKNDDADKAKNLEEA